MAVSKSFFLMSAALASGSWANTVGANILAVRLGLHVSLPFDALRSSCVAPPPRYHGRCSLTADPNKGYANGPPKDRRAPPGRYQEVRQGVPARHPASHYARLALDPLVDARLTLVIG
jgi:hypothetical protein